MRCPHCNTEMTEREVGSASLGKVGGYALVGLIGIGPCTGGASQVGVLPDPDAADDLPFDRAWSDEGGEEAHAHRQRWRQWADDNDFDGSYEDYGGIIGPDED